MFQLHNIVRLYLFYIMTIKRFSGSFFVSPLNKAIRSSINHIDVSTFSTLTVMGLSSIAAPPEISETATIDSYSSIISRKLSNITSPSELSRLVNSCSGSKKPLSNNDRKVLMNQIFKYVDDMSAKDVSLVIFSIAAFKWPMRNNDVSAMLDVLLERVDLRRVTLTQSDVTLILLGLARLGVRWNKSIRNSFLDQMPVLLRIMDCHQVSTCVWALGKIGVSWELQSLKLQTSITDAVMRTANVMTVRCLSNTIHGLSKQKASWESLSAPLQGELLLQLSSAGNIKGKSAQMGEQEASNIISGLGRLGAQWDGLPADVRNTIGLNFLAVLKELGPQGLAMSIHGLGRMEADWLSLPSAFCENIVVALDRISGAFNPQEVSNVLYGLGKMNASWCTFSADLGAISSTDAYAEEEGVRLGGIDVVQQIAQAAWLSTDLDGVGVDCAGVAHSYEHKHALPESTCHLLAQAVAREAWGMNAQGVSNVLWGLMLLGVHWNTDLSGTARAALWDGLKREAFRMDEQEIGNTLLSLSKMHLTWAEVPYDVRCVLLDTLEARAPQFAPKGLVMALQALSRLGLSWASLAELSGASVDVDVDSVSRVRGGAEQGAGVRVSLSSSSSLQVALVDSAVRTLQTVSRPHPGARETVSSLVQALAIIRVRWSDLSNTFPVLQIAVREALTRCLWNGRTLASTTSQSTFSQPDRPAGSYSVVSADELLGGEDESPLSSLSFPRFTPGLRTAITRLVSAPILTAASSSEVSSTMLNPRPSSSSSTTSSSDPSSENRGGIFDTNGITSSSLREYIALAAEASALNKDSTLDKADAFNSGAAIVGSKVAWSLAKSGKGKQKSDGRKRATSYPHSEVILTDCTNSQSSFASSATSTRVEKKKIVTGTIGTGKVSRAGTGFRAKKENELSSFASVNVLSVSLASLLENVQIDSGEGEEGLAAPSVSSIAAVAAMASAGTVKVDREREAEKLRHERRRNVNLGVSRSAGETARGSSALKETIDDSLSLSRLTVFTRGMRSLGAKHTINSVSESVRAMSVNSGLQVDSHSTGSDNSSGGTSGGQKKGMGQGQGQRQKQIHSTTRVEKSHRHTGSSTALSGPPISRFGAHSDQIWGQRTGAGAKQLRNVHALTSPSTSSAPSAVSRTRTDSDSDSLETRAKAAFAYDPWAHTHISGAESGNNTISNAQFAMSLIYSLGSMGMLWDELDFSAQAVLCAAVVGGVVSETNEQKDTPPDSSSSRNQKSWSSKHSTRGITEQAVVNTLHGFAAMDAKWRDLRPDLQHALLSALLRVSDSLGEQGVSVTVLSLAKLDVCWGEDLPEPVKEALRKAITRQSHLGEHALSSLLYGLSKLGRNWDDLHPMVQRALKEAIVVCHVGASCTPRGVANSLYGLAQMGCQWTALSTSVRLALKKEVVNVANHSSETQLVNIIWALSKMGVVWNELSEVTRSTLLEALSRRIATMNEQHVSTALFALAGMGVEWLQLPQATRDLLLKVVLVVLDPGKVGLGAGGPLLSPSKGALGAHSKTKYAGSKSAVADTGETGETEIYGSKGRERYVAGAKPLWRSLRPSASSVLGLADASTEATLPSLLPLDTDLVDRETWRRRSADTLSVPRNVLFQSVEREAVWSHCQGFSITLISLGKLGATWSSLPDEVNAATREGLRRCAPDMEARQLSNTIFALGKIGWRWDGVGERARKALLGAVIHPRHITEGMPSKYGVGVDTGISCNDVANIFNGFGVMGVTWTSLPPAVRDILLFGISRVVRRGQPGEVGAVLYGMALMECQWIHVLSARLRFELMSGLVRTAHSPMLSPAVAAKIMYSLSLLVFDLQDPKAHDQLTAVHIALLDAISKIGIGRFCDVEREQILIYIAVLRSLPPGLCSSVGALEEASTQKCILRLTKEVGQEPHRSKLQDSVVSALAVALRARNDDLTVANEYSAFGGAFPVDAMVFDGEDLEHPVAFVEVDGPHHYNQAGSLRRKDKMKETLYRRKHPEATFTRVNFNQVESLGSRRLAFEVANLITIANHHTENESANFAFRRTERELGALLASYSGIGRVGKSKNKGSIHRDSDSKSGHTNGGNGIEFFSPKRPMSLFALIADTEEDNS